MAIAAFAVFVALDAVLADTPLVHGRLGARAFDNVRVLVMTGLTVIVRVHGVFFAFNIMVAFGAFNARFVLAAMKDVV
jgi:hypothetical protein